jgi:hypothetical protein
MVIEQLGSAFILPVVGPADGVPSSAVGQSTDASTPPRSSRWAVEMPTVERTHCDSTDRRVAIPFPIKGGMVYYRIDPDLHRPRKAVPGGPESGSRIRSRCRVVIG